MVLIWQWLQSLSHPCEVASPCLFYKCFHVNCLNDFFDKVPRLYEFKCFTRLVSMSHQFTVELAGCNHKFYASSYFSHTSHLWNTLLPHGFWTTLISKTLNAMPIVINCLPDCSSIILALP